MSLYIGHYYGAVISANEFFSDDDIENYLNGENGLINTITNTFNFVTVGGDDAVLLLIAKPINQHEVYYPGKIEKFDYLIFSQFDTNSAETELRKNINEINAVLQHHGLAKLIDNSIPFHYFSYTVS